MGSDPDDTYIAGTVIKATEVTGSTIEDWTTIDSAPKCEAKWVWTNASGTPAYKGETVTFINGFTIPAGYIVSSACLEISADDKAAITVNQIPIGSHEDANGYPTGGPSGWDEKSAIDISAEVFQTGGNSMRVTVADDHAIHAGAVWCLRVCLDKVVTAECESCPPGTTMTKYVGSNPSSTEIITSPYTTTAVTNSYILQHWATIDSAAACGAKWVWRNALGSGAVSELLTFVNTFSLPVGWTVTYACIEISADDAAKVSVNDHYIGTHEDTDGFPSGGSSGWNEVSALDVPPAYFHCAANNNENELRVTVSNSGGGNAGSIWCLRVCLKQECPDTMTIRSTVANTAICDFDGSTSPAVKIPCPISSWVSPPCGAEWLWDVATGADCDTYPSSYVGACASGCSSSDTHTFCTTFDIPEGCQVASAQLKIAADDEVPQILLNNQYIGSHVDPVHHTAYDDLGTYSVDPSYFIAGSNTLKVTVKDLHDDRIGGTWCLIIDFL